MLQDQLEAYKTGRTCSFNLIALQKTMLYVLTHTNTTVHNTERYIFLTV